MTPKIILQPAGDGDAAEHYVDTIANPVPLNRIKPFVSENIFNHIGELYPAQAAPIWGVVPGGKGINIKKWERIDSGDVVLFSRNKRIFSSGVVTIKDHNKKLALDLWQANRDGETWEYLYFLDQIKEQAIPYPIFNKAAGFKSNNVIQGFNVLGEEKSTSIFSTFNLESGVYYPAVSKEEFNQAIAVLADSLGEDKKVLTAVRTEQSYLRKNLFGNKKISACGICGRQIPVDLLIVSHIKRRSECTLDERRDAANVVMPMCRLGCDDLFEKGYITVDNGRVTVSSLPYLPTAIQEYFKLISEKPCSHWSASSKKYFDWHKQRCFS